MNYDELEKFIVPKNIHLAKVMQKIDDNANGIVFIVDGKRHLCGAASDGDIRRWLLKGGNLDAQVSLLMNSKPICIHENERCNAVSLMREKRISALPIVDAEGLILDICLMGEHDMEECPDSKKELEGVSVVVMAGGKGTRLYPYTKILPKPLIPIGEIPIVERVMDEFHKYGIVDFYMTVNYKSQMIQSYFSEVNKDYHIEYVKEDKPLGTGGSIRLIEKLFAQPIFVANADGLIRTDYTALYQHHIDHGNAITMITSLKNETVPYGVIHSKEDGEIESMVEKPTMSYLINTGMYIIDPEMISLIPEDTMFHMTNLVEKAMELGYKVGMYPVSEDSFLDMGEFAEMKRMEEKLNLQ